MSIVVQYDDTIFIYFADSKDKIFQIGAAYVLLTIEVVVVLVVAVTNRKRWARKKTTKKNKKDNGKKEKSKEICFDNVLDMNDSWGWLYLTGYRKLAITIDISEPFHWISLVNTISICINVCSSGHWHHNSIMCVFHFVLFFTAS